MKIKKVTPKIVSAIRRDFKTGQFRVCDLSARYNLSRGYVHAICHNHVYRDAGYLPPVKLPVDVAWASKLHKQGLYSFDEIARLEQQISRRDKPLSAECLRQKVRTYQNNK